MKGSLSIVALAAGLSQVSATYFHNAPSFSCPGNSNNYCMDDYKEGLNWGDLNPGSFDNYKGFNWKGFTCSDRFAKRSELAPRKFQDKCITGKASKTKQDSPKMSCDQSVGNEKTSIRQFHIETAFDCDLEFHFDMPDGSTCKQRSHCQQSGTIVDNTQCGGATDVVIVYPEQPDIPDEDGCDFAIPSIIFDCDDNTPSTTYPPVSPPTDTSSSVLDTTTTYSATVPGIPTDTYTGSVPDVTDSYTASTDSYTASTFETTSSSYADTTTSSVDTTTTTADTTTTTADTTTSTAETTTSTAETTYETTTYETTASYSASESVVESSSTLPVTDTTTEETTTSTGEVMTNILTTPGPTTITSVTSYMTTSTVFSTVVSTITSCGPEVPDCPAGSATVVTQTVAVSTTVCPVTETYTSVPSTTAGTPTTTEVESSSSPETPVETLPCPGVVPSCLNTWMFIVDCVDNTDSSCYCPDKTFVNNVFDCLYAHGESDEVIQDAIEYFQGICAPYAPENPAIATGAETITTILTVTPTAPATAIYTTIEIIATTVVPCTDESGSEIPSSSSTITISTTFSAPEVIFTTITNVPGSTNVGIVPGVPATSTLPVETTAGPTTYPVSTFTTAKPSITATAPPSSTTTTTIPTAGAGRIGMGLAGVFAAAILAL